MVIIAFQNLNLEACLEAGYYPHEMMFVALGNFFFFSLKKRFFLRDIKVKIILTVLCFEFF